MNEIWLEIEWHMLLIQLLMREADREIVQAMIKQFRRPAKALGIVLVRPNKSLFGNEA
jgi:hypothetical protein